MSLKIINEKLQSIETMLKVKTLLKKKVINFKEAMFYLDISKSTLYEWIHKKNLPAYKQDNGKYFFIRKELDYWLILTYKPPFHLVERVNIEPTPDDEND